MILSFWVYLTGRQDIGRSARTDMLGVDKIWWQLEIKSEIGVPIVIEWRGAIQFVNNTRLPKSQILCSFLSNRKKQTQLGWLKLRLFWGWVRVVTIFYNNYHANIVKILWEKSWSNILQIKCKYCAKTVQILCKYCADFTKKSL